MLIKKVLELNINGKMILNEKERTLSIQNDDYIKSQIDILRIWSYDNIIHVEAENGKIVTLINCIDCNIDYDNNITHLQYEHIFEGISINQYFVDNIKKYKVTFQDNFLLKEDIVGTVEKYNIKLGKDFIQIESNNETTNSNIFFNEFMNIYQFISVCVGYFPRIKSFELYQDNNIIYEHGQMPYFCYSSNDMLKKKYSLVNLNEILDIGEFILNWNNLKENIGRYPIIGLFMSQMIYNKYMEDFLVTLLQSIDGYCNSKIKDKLPEKSDKDRKTIEYLKKSIDEYNILNNDSKKKIKEYIEKYHNPCFKDYLRYLIDNYTLLQEIFYEEIQLENNKKYECDIYLGRNVFLDKCVNERNKISHMTKKDKEKLFELFQSVNAYYKWLLAYRIIILQEIGIEVDKERLRNILNQVRTDNKYKNSEFCEKCKNANNCIMNNKGE